MSLSLDSTRIRRYAKNSLITMVVIAVVVLVVYGTVWYLQQVGKFLEEANPVWLIVLLLFFIYLKLWNIGDNLAGIHSALQARNAIEKSREG
ncbi:MAG: hypothetical protein AAB449_02025 [Patescibacteria group bacterium]